MTKPLKGSGRGKSPGSRDALRRAGEERKARAVAKEQEQARQEQARQRPHLRPFQTPQHLERMRQAKAAKRKERARPETEAELPYLRDAEEPARPRYEAAQEEDARFRADAEAATRARQDAEARERREEEERLMVAMTIIEAARLLGELPHVTIDRVRTGSLPGLTKDDGSTWVRVGDVERIIRDDIVKNPPVYHRPAVRIGEGEPLDQQTARLLFGAPPIVEPDFATIRAPLNPDQPHCPATNHRLVPSDRAPSGDVQWDCPCPVVQGVCAYQAVWRAASGEFVPPRIFAGWWTPPVGPLRFPPITIAKARMEFGDPQHHTLRVPKPPPSPPPPAERPGSGPDWAADGLSTRWVDLDHLL